MLFIEILMGTAILYLFSMFSILFHELGHLSGYKITIKSNDWIIQIGTGKELFRAIGQKVCVTNPSTPDNCSNDVVRSIQLHLPT